jgi:hypothetical protein
MVFDKLFSSFLKKGGNQDKESNTEMKNVINSMFLCTPLYDKLKVKCHPDRFIDENQKAVAENLFQELQKYKHNYERLLEIELQINDFVENTSKNI